MKRVLVAMPTYSGHIPIELMFNLMSLKVPEGYSVNFSYVKRTPIDTARNSFAQGALNGGYDYILFVDDDTIPPTDALEIMLAMDKPVIIPPIPARKDNGEGRLCIFEEDWSDELSEVKEERKIGGGGMACTLIKREVLEAVANKYGKPFAYGEWDGKRYSEDTSFCRRVNELGFEIWTTSKVTPSHIGQQMVYVYEPTGIETYVLPC